MKLRPDPNKGGFDPEQLKTSWLELKALPAMRIVGLMTMAPLGFSEADRRGLFQDCRQLANAMDLPQCSMGMSGDWPEAAAAGATWVRVGSALFGARPQ